METEKYYGTISIDQIHLNENNPRTISKDKLEKLKKSIETFPEMLELRPIILNENNVILGGNMRVTALKELGYTEVPYIKVTDLTPEQQKEFIIKDNVSYGDWNWDVLEEGWNQDLLLEWGMNIPENKFVQKDEAEEDDYTGGVPPTSRIKVGDVITIGPHRLMCGDSTNRDHVETLMNGELADLLLTDPPYGVSFTGVPRGKDWDMIQNDELRGDGLYNLLHGAFTNAFEFTKDQAPVYIWHPDNNYFQFLEALVNAGYYERQKLIWYKGMTFGRSDYHLSHEWCIYGVKKGQVPHWFGGRDKVAMMNHKERGELKNLKKEDLLKIVEDLVWNSDVWEIKKDAVITYVHPTQKPIPLSGKIINNSSPLKGLCMDLFSGSGSSMVAAHQLGRRMYGMELDPHYCEVIIDRMLHNDPSLKVKINGNDY
jgi:DNA modification methylase